MRKILVFALVALMAAPLIATAAPKLKMGVTIEDFNDVFMRYALDQLTAEATKRQRRRRRSRRETGPERAAQAG